jgi:uncharacterized small protein (DUF1192 family)
MSNVLPGMYYCLDHQGNHSHYAKENCALCCALAEVDRLKAQIDTLMNDDWGSLRREVERLKADRDTEYEQAQAFALKILTLRRLLRGAYRYVPVHDGYFHNPYIQEQEKCDVCQLRAAIAKQLEGNS